MKDFLTTPLLVGLMDQDCQIKIKIYFGLNIGSWMYGLPQRNCTPNATFYDKICCRPLHEYYPTTICLQPMVNIYILMGGCSSFFLQ